MYSSNFLLTTFDNSSGFTARGGGKKLNTNAFNYLNTDANFWTTTSGGAPTDVYYGGASYALNSSIGGQTYKVEGLSVRCVRDSLINSCPDLPIVTFQGKTYNTVKIGDQCWFRENLDVGTQVSNTVTQSQNGTVEKYCYNNIASNCDRYGALYQWGELMNYSTTPGAQGLCPDGWHVPTDTEWATLVTYLGGSSTAGGKMKEATFAHWLSPNVGATNISGMTILPSGYSAAPGGFGGIGRYGQYLTSTQYSSTVAWMISFPYAAENLSVLQNFKTTAGAVRCLKN